VSDFFCEGSMKCTVIEKEVKKERRECEVLFLLDDSSFWLWRLLWWLWLLKMVVEVGYGG
jgi:hypothetical protein